MAQTSTRDRSGDEETYGFGELFRALDVDTTYGMIQAETAIYKRTEDILDTDDRPDIAGDLEKMGEAGAVVASEYAEYIEKMDENSELPERFDDLTVRGKLDEIDSNISVLSYLS